MVELIFVYKCQNDNNLKKEVLEVQSLIDGLAGYLLTSGFDVDEDMIEGYVDEGQSVALSNYLVYTFLNNGIDIQTVQYSEDGVNYQTVIDTIE